MMTTKIEERNSNNSGMTEAETEATETETWDMSDEEAEARAKHSNEGLADDYIYNIRSGIGQLTRDCEDPKIRVVLLNLLRFAEDISLDFLKSGVKPARTPLGRFVGVAAEVAAATALTTPAGGAAILTHGAAKAGISGATQTAGALLKAGPKTATALQTTANALRNRADASNILQ